MAAFAEPTDVETAYEGSLPSESEDRVQYLLDTASARLRLLLPSLEARIAAADLVAAAVEPEAESDLTLMARDVVVQAVIRRLPGSQQQVASSTQAAGPFSTTLRYTADSTQTFSDDDLALLAPSPIGAGGVGTIKIGRPNWCDQ